MKERIVNDLYNELVHSVELLIGEPLTEKQKNTYLDYLRFVYSPMFSGVADGDLISLDLMTKVTVLAETENLLINCKNEWLAFLNDEDADYRLFVYTKGLVFANKSLIDAINILKIKSDMFSDCISNEHCRTLIDCINTALYKMSVDNRKYATVHLHRIFEVLKKICQTEYVDYVQYIEYSTTEIGITKRNTYQAIVEYFLLQSNELADTNKRVQFYKQLDSLVANKFTLAFLSEEYGNYSKDAMAKLSKDIFEFVISMFRMLLYISDLKE